MPGVQRLVDVETAPDTLLARLYGSDNHPNEQRNSSATELLNVVERCIVYGESNSILVVGPCGCGKTSLVDQTLKSLSLPDRSKAILVKLNGLLQTDDNVALEEMTRQMELDNVADDLVFGSFEQKLQFLLQSMRSGSRDSLPVVVVIDEFDLFSQHKNQTLLYNLFDVAQSKQTPICVIGLTRRLDVIELLEKRVKSRFSHRFVHMFHRPSLDATISALSSYLKLPDSKRPACHPATPRWNERVDSVLAEPLIRDSLRRLSDVSASLHSLKNLAALVIANASLKPPDALLEQSDVLEALKLLDADPRASLLLGLSVLDLSLIISMKQLTELYSDQPFTFQMVYEHYRKFSQTKGSMKPYPKAIAIKAFEHLIDLELVKPTERGGSVPKQYWPIRLLVSSREIEDAILHYNGCPSEIKQWATSSWVH